MKKIGFLMTLLLFATATFAQSAKSVLDKAAAAVSNQNGVSANFTMTTKNGSTSGTIAIKGNKFHATTPQAIVWFDGKTQWTYLKKNEEVNVNTPTPAEQQAVNPYNFINMYKKGYKYTMNASGNEYIVHLTATNKSAKIQEMFINVDKSSYVPTQAKMREGSKWTTFTLSNLKKSTLSDGLFRFNSKDYPSAEVIDLR